MREFRTMSLADQVFEKLENDIILGVYPRGEILTELKLVERLGVSRTPIREALRRLEMERLIEESGKGSVVLGITQEDLIDIMNIRQHVEGVATAYATKRMTDEMRKELEHIVSLQDYYCSNGDWEHLHQLDDKFHQLLCSFSGSTVIQDVILPLHRKSKRYRKAAVENTDRSRQMVCEHREIYEAIVKGDAQMAEKLTAEHIEKAKNNMLKGLVNYGQINS